jgi:hypothetical protein
MWDLSLLCKTTRTRPSEVVGIDDEWAAYQFDQAVMFVGRYIYSKCNELGDDGKPIHDIDDILGDSKKVKSFDLPSLQGFAVKRR